MFLFISQEGDRLGKIYLTTGWLIKNGPPFHTGFQLFLIVLHKSDEKMPYWLGLGDSFAVL